MVGILMGVAKPDDGMQGYHRLSVGRTNDSALADSRMDGTTTDNASPGRHIIGNFL